MTREKSEIAASNETTITAQNSAKDSSFIRSHHYYTNIKTFIDDHVFSIIVVVGKELISF